MHERPKGRPDRNPDEQTLAEAFGSVWRRMRHGMRDELGPDSLSPSHTRALGTLLRHGPMRLGALADRLQVAPRTTTEIIDALEDREFVAREPDPSDRRATIVRGTDEGWRVLHEARAAHLAHFEQLFDRLSATDRAHLARILRKLQEPQE